MQFNSYTSVSRLINTEPSELLRLRLSEPIASESAWCNLPRWHIYPFLYFSEYQTQNAKERVGYDQPPPYVQPAAGAAGVVMVQPPQPQGVVMVQPPQPQGVVVVQPPQSYPLQGIQTQQAKEHVGYDQPPAPGVTVVTKPQQPVIIPVPPQDTSHVSDYLIPNIIACILCPGCCWILGKILLSVMFLF